MPMKNGLTITAAAFLTASCCPRIMPHSDHRMDSVRTIHQKEYIEKLRDTTIYVEVPIEVREQVNRDSSHLETRVAVSDAWIADGLLRHTLENKKTSLPTQIQLKDSELYERKDSIVFRDVYIKDVVERRHIPKSYWWFMAVSIAAALWGFVKIGRIIRKTRS